MEKKSPDYNGTAELYLEVDDSQYDLNLITEKAKADFKANNKGKKLSDIKLYVKPEDKKAYYTANKGNISGSVDL
ncbi:MAG: hypothetical protein J6X66_01305 [Lachnospiraceae bacterium]|nr:hypothetical protein [Lachnospiraceae bacterium]